ncbi:hypothetical protein MHU86_3342 [Fragilaria crotonensis]|nr:hypothetical protein MHU86_3342 [Fragilaria crotonensis]
MAAVIGRGVQRGVGGSDQQCLKSPFIAYYIVVVSLNSVAVIGGAISQFDLHRGQSSWYNNYDRCDAWLFTNGIFGVLHILGALYIVRKIQEPEDAIEAHPMDYQLQQHHHHQQQQHAKGSGNTVWWQGNKVHVQPVHVQPVQLPQFQSNKPVISEYAQKSIGAPQSWVRVKHVLMENVVVAIYFLVYLVYLFWHMFVEMNPCNDGMRFTQRAADIFVVASPCAFVFSVVTMLMDRRQI